MTKYFSLSDEEIVQMITNNGKSHLFEVIYDRYSDKVLRKCLSFEKDRDNAKDLAHDIFMKVYLQLAKFQYRSRFSTWLYSVSYNHCVEFTRKKNKITFTELNEDRDDFADESDWEENGQIDIEQMNMAMDKIPSEDKMLLVLKYQEDVSIKELTEILHISESAVKMRLVRARNRMRATMNK